MWKRYDQSQKVLGFLRNRSGKNLETLWHIFPPPKKKKTNRENCDKAAHYSLSTEEYGSQSVPR